MADNLTRDEARARAALLNVSSYDVELDLTGSDDATFRSRTTVIFTCRKPGSSSFIEIAAPSLRGVTLNGAALDLTDFDGSRLVLSDLAEANTLVVDGDCAYSRTGEGLHRFVDPVDGEVYLYSQFETYDAHRMYACFDQPDLKANFKLRVKAPAHWTCISNGVGRRDDEPGLWTFDQTPRVSTYITALIAGPYHAVYDQHDGIDLGLFCRTSLAEFLDPEELFAVTKQGFDFYHRVFDYRYPFGKYDQLFVPEFNAGAMENAAAVTFLEDYVFRSKVTDARRERRAETILHEMAHMWFGDLVTMRWWDDLWLNESFATYASVLAQVSATRWKGAWTTFATTEKSWAARQDQLPSTHPIVADAVDMEAVKTNFDGITYAKGASVLKQLVAWVGQQEFLAGLRNYFRRFEYDNTSLRDLLDELEVASGRDLNGWAREWLETTGVNTLRPRFETDSSGIYTAFDVVQEAVAEHPTLRSHRIAIGLYDRTAAGLERRERVELDVSGSLTEVPKLLGARQPDLLLLNDDDLTYAKIRLDPRSLATTIESIGDVRESLPRSLLWGAAWDMTRDAEMAARDHLRLVLGGLAAESDISMVQTLLARASLAIDAYGDPTRRSQERQQLTDGVLNLLQNAPAGSDHQLALLYTFATAEDPAGLDRVRAILDGQEVLPGLELDTELRWHLLIELAAHGRASQDDIAAELSRDATAAGEKRAASARAAIPTAEAKAAAWAAVVERDDLSNHMQVATMRTFWRYEPEQIEVTKPYVAKYFDAVGDVWRQRSMDSAQTLTELLFPATVISEQTQAAVDQYLAEQSPQPALRRMLVEGRDTLARALRARAYDAQHG
ncbi:MAG TPA: aminopeptidase N [Frankiaceae bacterium]|nr:aminopeptidase N [Frankiaceae bacterium]